MGWIVLPGGEVATWFAVLVWDGLAPFVGLLAGRGDHRPYDLPGDRRADLGSPETAVRLSVAVRVGVGVATAEALSACVGFLPVLAIAPMTMISAARLPNAVRTVWRCSRGLHEGRRGFPAGGVGC